MNDLITYNPDYEITLTTPIKVELTKAEWELLTQKIYFINRDAFRIKDKYMKALICPLLISVYVRMHNKKHSLKPKGNKLSLSHPEASVLATALLEANSEGINYLVTRVTGIIDQKLT